MLRSFSMVLTSTFKTCSFELKKFLKDCFIGEYSKMTRFARAKGSKASNERVFEEATSWQEMKSQLLEKKSEIEHEKKRKEAEERRNSNYQNFLKEKEEQQANQIKWADFPNAHVGVSVKSKNIGKKTKNGNLQQKVSLTLKNDSSAQGKGLNLDEQVKKPKPKKKTKLEQLNGSKDSDNEAPTEASSKLQLPLPRVNKSKPKQKKLKILLHEEAKNEQNNIDDNKLDHEPNKQQQKSKKPNETDKKNISKTKELKGQKQKPKDLDSLSEAEKQQHLKKLERRKKQIENKKLMWQHNKELMNNQSNLNNKDDKVETDIKQNGTKTKKAKKQDQTSEESNFDSLSEPEKKKILKKRERRMKQLAKIKLKKEELAKNPSIPNSKKSEGQTEFKQNEIKAKIQKKEQKPKEIDIDSLPEAEKRKLLKKLEKKKKQIEKKKLKKQQNEELAKNENKSDTTDAPEYYPQEGRKIEKTTAKFERKSNFQTKIKDSIKKVKSKDGDFKRRKDFQANKIIINGSEVVLEYFDGFPIKKEDAEHLKRLKKEMVIKGLPRSEINRTLKLERRKAEKSLARIKKMVCFNCRKSGHILSECPDLSNKDNKELIDTSGTGICFKCGSTEHTSFVCRVVQGESFKFASCFICKEQGHISRQCPDNARGLYPKGGSCKVCGDVTHLKKDCPKFQVQQEKDQQKFHVETLGNGNLEDLDGANDRTPIQPSVKRNKIIKF